MTHSIRHHQTTRGAKAIAATRPGTDVRAFSTVILSLLLVLLIGAVWMQLT